MGEPLEVQLPHLTHSTPETQLTSHSGIRRILSEGVFLRIGSTEDVVTNSWRESMSRRSGAFHLTLTNYQQPRLSLPGDRGPSP